MVRCHCGKRASFNTRGLTKGRFCADHKEPDMVNVKDKTCESCDKIPVYNTRGQIKGRFCADHKEPDMVNVKHKTCESCDKIPAYNTRGQIKGRFCAEHKEPGMVDVISKTCESCDKRPTFNTRGQIKGRFCAEHKEPDMVDVKNKTCESCEKRPVYNTRGQIKGRFCAEHKEPGMVDVKNKTCESCEKQPTFNTRGQIKGRFCADHKEPDMVDVKNKTCESCEKQPAYNTSGLTKGRFCAEHKEPGMVDVKNKTCESCDTQPNYGWLGKGISRCASHRQKGMITSPNRKCNCKQLGTHEANGTRFCDEHMPIDAENLGVDTCTSCGLDDILTNGKCTICDPQVIQIRQHAKENRVRDVLEANGLGDHVHDRILEGQACGRERPDFQFDCGTHFVYCEVDEHQHRSYACECEQGRMINLVHVRGMPVRWIRYNPDVYEPMEGQRPVKLEQREKKLVEYIKWAMKHSPQEEGNVSSVLYLFYNDYDMKNQEWEKLI